MFPFPLSSKILFNLLLLISLAVLDLESLSAPCVPTPQYKHTRSPSLLLLLTLFFPPQPPPSQSLFTPV